MSGARHWEQDKEATVYIGNLDERVTDALVWELMLQAGRIVNVHLPKDRVIQTHQGFGFVEFISEEDAEYAARIMNQVRLFGKPIRVNKASADKQKTVEVGAELFVGNLDPMVDEKTLYDTFSAFGNLVSAPKIARDEAGISKGFGFISYDSFEASDAAIEAMDKQFLMNKDINVQYAYKKDGKGERHGDEAERLLAQQAKKHNIAMPTPQLPPQLFAPSAPATAVPPTSMASIPNAPAAFRPQPPQSQPPFQQPSRPPSGPPQNFGPPPQQQPQLGPPPQGLPPRPPPVGFPPPPQAPGGYPQMHGMHQPPPGFGPPPGAPPPGFAGQPVGMPTGFGAPPPRQGMPPQGYPGGYPQGLPPPPAGFGRR